MIALQSAANEMSDSTCAPQDASSTETIVIDGDNNNNNDDRHTPPKAPAAATSPRTAAHLERTNQEPLPGDDEGLFDIKAEEVLKLLSQNIEALVRMTGDIPPTPPPSSPTVPHMSGMQAEKENIVRSHSEKNLALLAANAASGKGTPRPVFASRMIRASPQKSAAQVTVSTVALPDGAPEMQDIDGVHLKRSSSSGGGGTPIKAAGGVTKEPYIIHGADAQPLNTQYAAMSRKFYSKKPPPISITAYLARIHQWCPMSTAVYLATALYIQRMAVTDRTVVVTDRNVHRLLLSGLRVANKALEDREWCWALSRMSKVGGVSEAELTRYEIGFCFLANFELVPTPDELKDQWYMLKSGSKMWAGLPGMMTLNMDPTPKRKREPSGSSDNAG